MTFEREYSDAPQITGVSAQLQQVFVNLLSNALDATVRGGSVVVGCRPSGSKVEAYVKDFGEGIPEDELSLVFGEGIPEDELSLVYEPFYTTKEVGEGTGLGLFVCHNIILAHKGEVFLSSVEGEGTTVKVRLPISVPQTAESEERELAGSGRKS